METIKKVVRNCNTLKAMERAGHIKLDCQTGSKVYWRGRTFTAYYIWEAVDYKTRFTYKNRNFAVEYVDGCFKPFVYELFEIN